KFEGGWHGLHDYALVGNGWRPSTEPYPTPTADIGGIPKGAVDSMLVVPFNDVAATADTIDRYGDEVVTGFRLAYGGAQEFYGVTPDLATYGKALTCGYSLAAIAGRADLMATA